MRKLFIGLDKYKFWLILLGILLVGGWLRSYSHTSAKDFQYGMIEAFTSAVKVKTPSERIVMTTVHGDPRYHALISQGISPANYHAGKLKYAQFHPITWPIQDSHAIIIGSANEIPVLDPQVIDIIRTPVTGEILYIIARI